MEGDERALDVSTRGSLVRQGAEARVWEAPFLERPAIVKQRFSKKYRAAELDERLTLSRIKQEARSMLRARKLGVLTPVLYMVEYGSACLYMEKVAGRTVKDVVAELEAADRLNPLLDAIGRAVARMHDGGLIHGDLTTSNLMVREGDGRLVIIDFGLSSYSKLSEDKGVDLYVMERAFTSAHAGLEGAFERVLEAYKGASKYWSSVLNRFAEVRMRGRKRTMVG
ncbi:unnamed protein product [Ostreobium quekettii]|uniref:non-specific serine/threonine protein kinase n=1 Tax=Ostreobium quekettii TaxID=121088 RepID=A0A8S1INB7_9CHLO|nr:unnamed protein product [Ostreobium quekettii]|eukprot:evm.model.scf_2703.1 EVM.evm.TU.scf_2703.1   scf_2703:3874-4548(+)